ncbi:MAG: 2-dehydropantoate 2-reductase [Burkholderiaceae bacterium]|jgi:2-dehydropantoate 2-reductase|nr:2-dehydropantoate 2-reductase [Burkholderiaceae bacterium]
MSLRIAIVGAGAIGGYLGVKLSLAGHDVTFIARGANLQAIQHSGMKLMLEDGNELHAKHVKASDIAGAKQYDYVLVTLKSHQVAPVAADIAALCHEHSCIVTLQNGLPWWYFHELPGEFKGRQLSSLDPNGQLWQRLKPERVIGAAVYPAAELVAPGVVRLIEGNRFTLGEPSGEKSERVMQLAQAMIGAGFKTPVSNDIRSELWVKLWGNLSFNPVSALTHATLQDIAEFAPSREVVANMMQEAQAVAERTGIQFKISIDKRIAGAQAVGAHKTSMLQDIEQGKALELDALLGSVIELGHIVGIATPTLHTVHNLCLLLQQSVLRSGHGLSLMAKE